MLLPVKGGKERWFEVHIAFQHGRDGQPVVGVGLLFNIMDQKDRILELEKELSMDAFTRTLNKTALESYGTRRLAQLGPRQQLTLLILDMDDFKTINDTYGHQAGDHVLVQLASLMNALAPARCRVGRLGGDEFAAIFDPPCTRTTAENYAARLIEAVRRIEWEGKPCPPPAASALRPAPAAAPTTPCMPLPTKPCTRPSGRARAGIVLPAASRDLLPQNNRKPPARLHGWAGGCLLLKRGTFRSELFPGLGHEQ